MTGTAGSSAFLPPTISRVREIKMIEIKKRQCDMRWKKKKKKKGIQKRIILEIEKIIKTKTNASGKNKKTKRSD